MKSGVAQALTFRKFLISAAIGVVLAIALAAVFRILIFAIAEHLLPFWGISPGLLEIGLGDLLAFFGVAVGLCYSVWIYMEDRAARAANENERLGREKTEWLRHRPEFNIESELFNGYMRLTLNNVGGEAYRFLRYINSVHSEPPFEPNCCFAKKIDPGEVVMLLVLKSDFGFDECDDMIIEEQVVIDVDWRGEKKSPGCFALSMYGENNWSWLAWCDLSEDGRIGKLEWTNG